MPHNGTNPNRIVIFDKCAIHYVNGVVELLHEHGVMVHFLPLYSQGYNPLEEDFLKVKCTLKSMETVLHGGLLDLHTCMAVVLQTSLVMFAKQG